MTPELDMDWIEEEAACDEGNTRTVDDVAEANDLMRKVAFLRAKKADVDAARNEQVREWDAWRDREHKRLDGPLGYFEGLLEDYQRRRLEDGGPKTLDLPAGRVKTTTPSAPSIVLDGSGKKVKDRLLAWAKQHLPDVVTTTEVESVTADDVKKRVRIVGDRVVLVSEKDGDMVDVDGLTVKPAVTTFTIDPDGGAS